MSWSQAIAIATGGLVALVGFGAGVDYLAFNFPRTMRVVAAVLATGLVLAGFAYIIKNWS